MPNAVSAAILAVLLAAAALTSLGGNDAPVGQKTVMSLR